MQQIADLRQANEQLQKTAAELQGKLAQETADKEEQKEELEEIKREKDNLNDILNSQVPKYKIQRPSVFSGDKAEEDVQAWIFSVEEYAVVMKMREHEVVPFAASYLTGSARFW